MTKYEALEKNAVSEPEMPQLDNLNPDFARKIEIARPPIGKRSTRPTLPAAIFKRHIGRTARLDRTRISGLPPFRFAI
jgi:hypothetical protein